MKQLTKIVAFIGALSLVACNKEETSIAPVETTNQEKVTVESLKVGDAVSMNEADRNAEMQVPSEFRNLNHEPSQEEKDLIANIKQRKTLSPTKNVQVYAYLYCESKGGDDGTGLEIFGHTTANIVNVNGVITTPPNFGSSFLMNRSSPLHVKPGLGNIRYLSTVRYSVANAAAQYLRFSGHLKDDDRNSDDGFFPNAADNMGTRTNFLNIGTAMTAYPYVYWQRYADGGQVAWIKNVVYVW